MWKISLEVLENNSITEGFIEIPLICLFLYKIRCFCQFRMFLSLSEVRKFFEVPTYHKLVVIK